MGWAVSCRKEIEGALRLFWIDAKTLTLGMSDHEAKMLVITICQILVDFDKPIGRLQGQHRAPRLECKNAMHEAATLDPYHGTGARAGRHDGRNIGFRRIEYAEASSVAQVLSKLNFIVQQP